MSELSLGGKVDAPHYPYSLRRKNTSYLMQVVFVPSRKNFEPLIASDFCDINPRIGCFNVDGYRVVHQQGRSRTTRGVATSNLLCYAAEMEQLFYASSSTTTKGIFA